MADETVINGQTDDDFNDADQNNSAKVTKLTQLLEGLENVKSELIHENQEMKNKLEKLTEEIRVAKIEQEQMKYKLGEMEREIEQSDDDNKVLESIAARADELEGEVVRLQHDLISAMNESGEANKELAELKRVLGDKGMKIDGLEMEIEFQKKEKAENEKKIKNLDRHLGVLEAKESEERSKRLQVEEEMAKKFDNKDKDIAELKKKLENLESAIATGEEELEKWKGRKTVTDEILRQSEEKAKAVELKLLLLQRNFAEAENVVRAMTDDNVKSEEGKMQWPVLAVGSVGVIAAAVAVAFVCFPRKK